jgi:hypothetical protein
MMQIEGAIHPVGDGAGLTRGAWCQLVTARPEFRRHPLRQARNSFTGGVMTVHPRPDAAEVVVDGRVVGQVYWSMSDEPLVNLTVESSALPLVREWAAALGGEFRQNSPGSSGERASPLDRPRD